MGHNDDQAYQAEGRLPRDNDDKDNDVEDNDDQA
jgi:hypothetical protein